MLVITSVNKQGADMRISAIFLSLMAVIWLVLCLYLVLPQLINLNFTGHIVLGGLVASLPATTALLGFVMILLRLINKLDAIEKRLDGLQAGQTSENHQHDSDIKAGDAPTPD